MCSIREGIDKKMKTECRQKYLDGPARERLIVLIIAGYRVDEINQRLKQEGLLPYEGYVVDHDQAYWIRRQPDVANMIKECRETILQSGYALFERRVAILHKDIEDTISYLFPDECDDLELKELRRASKLEGRIALKDRLYKALDLMDKFTNPKNGNGGGEVVTTATVAATDGSQTTLTVAQKQAEQSSIVSALEEVVRDLIGDEPLLPD